MAMRIKKVTSINIDYYYCSYNYVVETLAKDLDRLAVKDGFSNWRDLVKWFEREHGLPFTGILIEWEPPTGG